MKSNYTNTHLAKYTGFKDENSDITRHILLYTYIYLPEYCITPDFQNLVQSYAKIDRAQLMILTLYARGENMGQRFHGISLE